MSKQPDQKRCNVIEVYDSLVSMPKDTKRSMVAYEKCGCTGCLDALTRLKDSTGRGEDEKPQIQPSATILDSAIGGNANLIDHESILGPCFAKVELAVGSAVLLVRWEPGESGPVAVLRRRQRPETGISSLKRIR